MAGSSRSWIGETATLASREFARWRPTAVDARFSGRSAAWEAVGTTGEQQEPPQRPDLQCCCYCAQARSSAQRRASLVPDCYSSGVVVVASHDGGAADQYVVAGSRESRGRCWCSGARTRMKEGDWPSPCDDSGLQQVPAGALPPRVMRDGVDPPGGRRVSTGIRCGLRGRNSKYLGRFKVLCRASCCLVGTVLGNCLFPRKRRSIVPPRKPIIKY